MKEIKDFMHMIGDLASMSDCPNFSDEMRNKAVDLMLYINRKPEPEKPLIVKSGGTWAAHFEGVDYLCIDPQIYSNATVLRDWQLEMDLKHWKPFSEITLDDEIAKLRPTIKYGDRLFILFAVWDNVIYTNKDDYWMNNFADTVRLATPKELQELP